MKRLKNQLHRELTQNKKKAAVLAAISVVAVYFWAPLISGWVRPETNTPTQSAEVATETQTNQQPSLIQPTKLESSTAWIDRLKIVQHSHALQPGTLIDRERNPFGVEAPLQDEIDSDFANEIVEIDEPYELLTPDEAGLFLEGTIVGNRRRVAKIGGELYLENDVIKVGESEGSETSENDSIAEFTIRSIDPHQVTLTQEDQTYTLRIESPAVSRQLRFKTNPRNSTKAE